MSRHCRLSKASISAFSQRIQDSFPQWDLTINDFEHEARMEGVANFSVDLNRDYSGAFGQTGYDLVLAIEVLEHLENPWHFLREVRKLLTPGGILILTTPNVDSTLDRLIYLIEGHSFYFGERGYTNSGGHITPVPDWLVRKIAAGSGYEHVELSDSVDTAPHVGLLTRAKLALLMPLAAFVMRNRNNRSINVYVCY